MFLFTPVTISKLAKNRCNISVGEVHLWLCQRDAVADSQTFCRQLFSYYAAPAPADWQFEEIGEGKPRLVRGQAELDYNLSHSGELLVCAVTSGAPVGVDIEFEKPARDVMRLASRFFNDAEVTALELCATAELRKRFYDLWTLKEATVKSQGEALAPLLKTVSFGVTYSADSAANISPDFDDPRASYTLFEPAPNYRLALCFPNESMEQPSLRQFHWSGPEDYCEKSLPLLGMSGR